MFVRRCYLSFRKLSFAGQIRLLDDFLSWRNGDKAAGYDVGVKERLNGEFVSLAPMTHRLGREGAKSGAFRIADVPSDLGCPPTVQVGALQRVCRSMFTFDASPLTLVSSFQSAQKSGEYNVASDSMRRFFDQRFAMTDDSFVTSFAQS